MTRGGLIFAHNNRDVDYALLAVISGGLAKKNLRIPVSLITDESTIEWMKTSNIYKTAVTVFDKIILVNSPKTNNTRRLHDGNINKTVPFVNTNRNSVWDLTPYDQTLLIDSDFLIFSDRLNEFWNVDEPVLISTAMNDVYSENRVGYHDRYISDTGVHMYWATTVMFTKNSQSRAFFDTVQYVKTNYEYYADIFRFDPSQYRNDIAFSIAKHILGGFTTDTNSNLPPVLTAVDRDILHSVDANGKLTFLINYQFSHDFCAASITDMDLHIMNKQSIIRNAESLLALI